MAHEPLIIYETKPVGITTSQHTKIIRDKYAYIKKIAYTGRLDIMASGMMKYIVNDECKNVKSHLTNMKTYRWKLVLGLETDTLDSLGLIQEYNSELNIEQPALYKIIEGYRTTYEQIYPVFSTRTVEFQGRKKSLIEIYLKHGIIPEERPTQQATIHRLNIIDDLSYQKLIPEFIKEINKVDDPNGIWRKEQILKQYSEYDQEILFPTLELEACVSSGTFIRQLSADIAKKYGTVGIAYQITRQMIH
jgi:tRNA pseudouridine(55) synthase